MRLFLAMWVLASCAAPPRAAHHVRPLRPEDRLPIAPWLDRDRKRWEVVTLVIVGERLWRDSCDVAGLDGLCVERALPRPACSAGEGLSRHPRNATAEKARMHFRGALKRYERAGLAGGEAEAAIATARLRLADDQLEALLAVGFPSGLDFEREEPRSLDRLAAFRREVDGRALGARRAYGSLAGTAMAVPALAREAFLFGHVAGLLRRAELPRRPEDSGFVLGFCETMAELAGPWDEGASRLSEACAGEAARRGEPDGACRSPR